MTPFPLHLKTSHNFPVLLLTLIINAFTTAAAPWTPVVVKEVKVIGTQVTPNLTQVSRDGGTSVLLNDKITWLYDDTECRSQTGKQLSFISNTAAYSTDLENNVTTVKDGGLVLVSNEKGKKEYAILADKTVGNGGWIPFGKEEVDYNGKNQGKQRIAIWPGANPTPINRTHAILYAPLVYVDSKPEDPAKKYVSRGTTLISVTAPDSGPIASRTINLLFPHDEISFGGFAALVGSPSIDSPSSNADDRRDVYLFGVIDSGLQLARVPLRNISDHGAYTYFQPSNSTFSPQSPSLSETNKTNIYLPGTFTSGGIFYSVYFQNFVFVYYNREVDSVFYIRYLDLEEPRSTDPRRKWIKDGWEGYGITADDVEALARYHWSSEQILYKSKPAKGGFNYAGAPHPEFFNRHYYPPTEYFALPQTFPYPGARKNEWYGASEMSPSEAGADGKHLLLSWTSQERGGFGTGIYQIGLARVEFDEIPPKPKETTPKKSGAARFRANNLAELFGMDVQNVITFRIVTLELGLLFGFIFVVVVFF
ncbi:MAG: hypothetical protein M1825_002082 [Sarcosagium campestre]|nr:MAG: hypothetical protein M1825_002082 [Sarcosagium campestre]